MRQGPVLWSNINRILLHPPLTDYQPQSGFLKLINTGDGRAIAEYKRASHYGKWAWKLKDRIDSQFMSMYHDYQPMPNMVAPLETQSVVRCLGCGGKIGSELLSAVLAEQAIPDHDDVIIGLDHPDDSAIIRTHDNQVTVTTDFFASPLDDPYLLGRIAVLNAASDCFVMGAQPTACVAMMQLPIGHPMAQLRLMRELMTGSLEELRRMKATIVGGHSIEGPQLTVGFTFFGRQLCSPRTKSQLAVGDQLILSKPLGLGVLLAALMRCQLPAEAYQPLLEVILQSNQIALDLIAEFDVAAITDVTGFGLAGHLAEMLIASNKSAVLEHCQIPILPDAQKLVEAGVQSTLADDNRLVRQRVELEIDDINSSRHALLFDPQTNGGLLLGVSAERAAEVLQRLHASGMPQATIIGEVLEPQSEMVRLEIR